MRSSHLVHRSIVLLVVALVATGCGAGLRLDARDAWSKPEAPLEESMLPSHETWTVDARPRSPLADLVRFFFALGSGSLGGHVACGPDDDACAARLRSAPVHAADWQNRFPTL